MIKIFNKQLSRGEICVANFIPPANGASQGNYFPPKNYSMNLNMFQSYSIDEKYFLLQFWHSEIFAI